MFVEMQRTEVLVTYRRGLPVITVPLPSRRERCRFTLRPVSQTVGDLLEQVKAEDRGVERAVALAPDDRVRIAASDTIESLLENDFRLVINDTEYYVKSPPQERLSSEEIVRLSDVRNLVNQLYEALNVREHQIRKERELRGQLEKLSAELQPLEEVNYKLIVHRKKYLKNFSL
ncbi:Coiled-coil domain-containing protein 109A [Papilio machaon]|uniref:Calcium uniporter protein n=1 Tax=Papilio machaon TaxID=76193 RepID=A0A0N1ID88_PAPMA|nr:Coiled-coil domain-containing protein 109A [Papilio machaon]